MRIPTRFLALVSILALALACEDTGGAGQPLDQVEIDAQGGVVVSGAASVTIPEGALAEPVTVSIRETTDVPEGAFGAAFEFLPDGQQFATPITIGLTYDPATLPAEAVEADLVLATLVAGAWVVVPGSTADVAQHVVQAQVSHFSIYAVFLVPPCVATTDCAGLPNPTHCVGAWQCVQGLCAWQCGAACVDGELGAACGEPAGVGICTGGTLVCTNGAWVCNAPAPQAEACNGLDDDCDGVVDEDLTCGPCTTDADCGDGLACVAGACVAESCSGDTDCDGIVDGQDNCPDAVNPDQLDTDGDGVGDACPTASGLTVVPASLNFGVVTLGQCADLVATVTNQGLGDAALASFELSDNCGDEFRLVDAPSAPVTVAAGQSLELTIAYCPRFVGSIECELAIYGTPDSATVGLFGTGIDGYPADQDGDGFSFPDDCDDADAAVNPAAQEVCDDRDNDCDGQVDEEGCGDPCAAEIDCAEGYVCVAGVCVAEGEPEICDGLDNDGNGVVDDGDLCDSGACFEGVCISDCAPLAEICNGLDDDCDGQVDEDACDDCASDDDCAAGQICLAPGDNCCSGAMCTPDMPYCGTCGVDPNGDDLDGDGIPDGMDNCPLVANGDQADLDQDGVGDACDADLDNDGYPATQDCDDRDPSVNPAAVETCDGVDNDCDGLADEGC